MKMFNKIKNAGLLAVIACSFFAACNKAPLDPVPLSQPEPSTAPTLAKLLDDPGLSIFKAAVVKAGLLPTLSAPTLRFTMFVPNDAAMTASGLSLGVIDALPVTSILPLVSYHIIPQEITTSSIPNSFPNFQYPTIFNPAPTLSALLRLTTFPTTRNGLWLNNIPVTVSNTAAANGVMHNVAFVVAPPQRYLWDRINTDPGLTYLKAAIIRADSGTAAPGTLQGALLNIGANLTVFAPTDAAFQATLTGAIYQGLLPVVIQQLTAAYTGAGLPPATAAAKAAADAPPIALGKASGWASSPAVFTNDTLFSVLTAQFVKGVVVYHILGSRAFTNNFPTTITQYPTLLNGALPTNAGVGITAVFGAPFVSTATIKGVKNATAANIIINTLPLTPDPLGTSDQHYLNGVLHKIDQVLIPL